MADIKDCIGKRVKISKNSITIRSDSGKTCGVIKNISSLYDLQANMQMDYWKRIKQLGLTMTDISMRDIIIKYNDMYIFRDIKGKLFAEKHGYFSEQEKKRAEEKERIYNTCREAGIDVIECILL